MKKLVTAVAVLVLAGCGSISTQPPQPLQTPQTLPPDTRFVHTPVARTQTPVPRVQTPVLGLREISDEGHVSQSVTLTLGECHARDNGQLPDPSCTPGSVDPAVTQATIQATICKDGYTATIRPPESETEALKFDVIYPAYSEPPSAYGELDHLVPLELGGSNDVTNLWPEIGPIPNSKDDVESQLRDAVCSGQVTLEAARRAIAEDWITAEQVLGLSSSVQPSSPVQATTTTPIATSCYPTTFSGHCYEPGEFCSGTEHGETGIAGDSKVITCRPADGVVWHWEES